MGPFHALKGKVEHNDEKTDVAKAHWDEIISKGAISCLIQNILGWSKILLPCPFTGRKMFCACPNYLCQTKNLFTYCASHKHFVPDKKMICIQ